jgi:RNA polymerase sigma factor (sigma-70 family)
MNHNEIEACVIRAKKGSKEDLLKVIEQFKPFIYKTANGFNIKNCDINDLAQIGCIAIIKAVLKYKIGSHTFSSYAYNAVKNELKYTARAKAKAGKDFSINTPVDGSGENDMEYVDCLVGAENIEEDILKDECYRELRQALWRLSEEERELVRMVYFRNMTLKAYAEMKGMGYQEAYWRKRRVLEKLGGWFRR